MGFMDKFSKVLGGRKSTEAETVKGPSATLRDHGIDPSNLKFSFNADGSVTVGGHVGDQAECDRICQVVGEIPNVKGVKNEMIIGAPQTVTEPETEVAETPVAAKKGEKPGRTYTVKSGDTLWAIAQEMYGSGGKYMKIFEANTTILKDPDKIRPGQVLVIPDIEES